MRSSGCSTRRPFDLATWTNPLTVTVTNPSGAVTFPAPGATGDAQRYLLPRHVAVSRGLGVSERKRNREWTRISLNPGVGTADGADYADSQIVAEAG